MSAPLRECKTGHHMVSLAAFSSSTAKTCENCLEKKRSSRTAKVAAKLAGMTSLSSTTRSTSAATSETVKSTAELADSSGKQILVYSPEMQTNKWGILWHTDVRSKHDSEQSNALTYQRALHSIRAAM